MPGTAYPILMILFLLPFAVPAVADSPREAPSKGVHLIDEAFARGGAEAVSLLLPFLKDRDLEVRTNAMRRLVEIGEPAVDPLLAAFADESMRVPAAGVLLNIGSPAVRKTVLAVKHRDPAVRRGALFILQQLEVTAAAPSVQAALSDPDASVQVQAIRAVAHFRGPGALRLLLEKVDTGYPPAVRDAAIEALAGLGEEAVPPLRSMYLQGGGEMRVAAVRALGGTGTREGIELVRSALSDPSALVRYYACRTLADAGDTSSAGAVAALLGDPDPAVREAAGEACARMPEAAAEALFRLLREGNDRQKIEAATALRKAAYRPAVSLLAEVVRDPSPEVRLSAAAALMVLSGPGAVEALVNGLRDPQIRWVCIIGLRQAGTIAVPILLRRTGDPELDFWKQHVLSGMGERAIEGCVEALDREKDAVTRSAALCTLEQIRDARAAWPVVRMLGDPQVGSVAVFLAARMGPVAVEPLLLTLRSDNPDARIRAADALGEMREARAAPVLREMSRDPDPAVREAASIALRRILPGAPPR
ncbi:MAG: HEAT repeat domain-containing protein [Deltaproteobacteria bacterium]